MRPSAALKLIESAQGNLFYGGGWQPAKDVARISVSNPATGEFLAEVIDATAADIDLAVRSAAMAFPAWRALRPVERGKILREASRRLCAHAEELAMLDALDAGLPVREMILDVNIAAAQLEYFAGLVSEIKGETLPLGSAHLNYSVREPLGVVVRIHPFNHPLMFAAGKVAAALAAGNTVIGKSAEQTPLSAFAIAEIWSDLFPPGVFNVLSGGRAAGAALVDHELVAKIGVIGSVQTGRAVMRSAAEKLKKVTLELGGKNALIAYADADPIKVAAAAVTGMNFGWTAGQSCGSTTRIFLHDAIHDAAIAEMARLMAEIRPGLPTDPETRMGCLISATQQKRVLDYIRSGKEEGARLICGGQAPNDPALAQGFYVLPTLFADVLPEMRIAREEIFGPVVAAMRWSDEDVMMREVNGLEYGLTASIWTNNLTTAHRTAARVEAGYIWINGVSSHFLGAPFGGYKQSGLGREECLEELMSYTQTKNINVALND